MASASIRLKSSDTLYVREFTHVRVYLKEGHNKIGNPTHEVSDMANFYYPHAEQYNFVGKEQTVLIPAGEIRYVEVIDK